MVIEKITVINPSGLHLRPAGLLAARAMKCKSTVTILYQDKKINAKSVLNVISAGIKQGTEIEVVCDGDTEAEDLTTMINAITGGLGEV